jgi:D-alanyl-D-alanine carboxypeptidase
VLLGLVAGAVALVSVFLPDRDHEPEPRLAAVDRSELDEIADDLVAGGAPGAVVVVRTPAGTVHSASGLASREPRVEMRPDDRFRIASVTKTFVATVVLQLVAEGTLSLDDPVRRWLPDLVRSAPAVTIRELLDHTSGIADFDEDADWVRARYSDPGREWSARELVAIAMTHPVHFAAGTDWSYSNTNYVLLGLLVEAATGRSIGTELQNRLIRPLHLDATSFPAHTAIEGRFAHGYVGGGSGVQLPEGQLLDVTALLSPSGWGAGQIVSNADDVTTFFAALMAGRLLPSEQLAAMETSVPGHDYALGLRIVSTPCATTFGNDGDFPGYRNVVLASANGDRVVSVMVNIDTTHVPWSTLYAAAREAMCSV